MGSGAAEDEASEPEAAGAGAGSTETRSVQTELHHTKIFSTARWTICHQLFFLSFFYAGLHVSAGSHIQICVVVFGGGGWVGGGGFLSPEDLNTGLRLFTILLPVFLWAKAVDPVHLNVFPPFHFKNMTLCIFVEQKIAKL